MKSNGSIYVGAVFALLAGYLAYQWWFNQNRVVKRRLGELAATLSVPADETELDRVARLARLSRYLAGDVRVTGGRHGQDLASRDAVIIAASGFRPAKGARVDFVDVDVKVDGDTARAYATAQLTMRDRGTDDAVIDSREAVLTIVWREDAWMVSAAEVKEAVKEPPQPSVP